jgi:3-polyprenyl-4-hydroxybenzoate decarboxylase
VSLGLPVGISAFDLMEEWERRMDTAKPIPPTTVADGPITQNVFEGDDIDLEKFPTPKWHEQDGGRYLGTGVCVITRDPDSDWVNMGTYRVMIHDRNHTCLSIPARAEIALEGFLHRDERRLEGPVGEWTGYYASASRGAGLRGKGPLPPR